MIVMIYNLIIIEILIDSRKSEISENFKKSTNKKQDTSSTRLADRNRDVGGASPHLEGRGLRHEEKVPAN